MLKGRLYRKYDWLEKCDRMCPDYTVGNGLVYCRRFPDWREHIIVDYSGNLENAVIEDDGFPEWCPLLRCPREAALKIVFEHSEDDPWTQWTMKLRAEAAEAKAKRKAEKVKVGFEDGSPPIDIEVRDVEDVR